MADNLMFKLLVTIIGTTIIILSITSVSQCSSGDESFEYMSKTERAELKEEARDMFYHAYNAYMDNAYPADELMPLSCKGRYRGSEADRGDIDSVLGNFSLTLVDTLDTLVVLGDLGEFENAVKLVVRDVSFDTDVIVSLFETNIRMLGGLLSGHILSEYLQARADIMSWYRGELLTLAKDLGFRFLPAFNTSTGIPYGRINLKYGMKGVPQEMCRETCTACAGSMILEMAALSRLTGEMIFEEKAQKAMDALWKIRHRGTDLMGSVLNVHSGDWVRRDSGVGAGIDSYYEYCLKAYILLGDEKYLGRFNKHYQAIMKYVSQGPMLLDVHMHRPNTNSKNFMDALLAFWPGLQVLKGDIKPAVETHEMLYQVMQRHNFIPEAFTTDFQVHWGHHPLRPEFLESTYFLYRATGDHYYLGVGKKVLKSLQTYARVPCGYAAVSDVRTNKHDDTMDSFVLSETFKYLFLLFAEPNDLVLDLDEFIFTTEGHLLPLTLGAMRINASLEADLDAIEVDELDRTCPNSLHLFPASVRQPLRNMVEDVCPRRSLKRRLSASQFQANNIEHIKLLSNMGIVVLTMADGRMQLLHTFSNAKSMEDAQEGLMFMQDMVELNKKQSLESEKRRVAIKFSKSKTESDKEVVLIGGPAEFGLQLKGLFKVIGKPVLAEPLKACDELKNAHEIEGNIAIVWRGDCMFVDKARTIQKAGAIGGIVMDSVIGSSIKTSPMFGMAGDGVSVDDIKIPLVFLFNLEAGELLQGMAAKDGAIVVTMEEYVNVETKANDSEDYSSVFERLKESVQQFLARPATSTESKMVSPEPPKTVQNEAEQDTVIDVGYLRAIIPKQQTQSPLVKLITNLPIIPPYKFTVTSEPEMIDTGGFSFWWQSYRETFITRILFLTQRPPNVIISLDRIKNIHDWLLDWDYIDKDKQSNKQLDNVELITWFLNELRDAVPDDKLPKLYYTKEANYKYSQTLRQNGHRGILMAIDDEFLLEENHLNLLMDSIKRVKHRQDGDVNNDNNDSREKSDVKKDDKKGNNR
ncbi:ER degradation-enhancing alpha-mannosidase-like protein 3 [Chelonus insularis]|uniref:ER degradation-enhancing alpha-mannosidase-like protein 3 n=1 Tax=Chelonus insularis TaxID=460826 RepID=UPI00158C53C0|nr:ER degradation-enhancing alpha-mannosidase-like protein 3 [Chelonus insularis]